MQNNPSDIQRIKEWFVRFAEKECRDISPFYYQLAHEIATDVALLRIAAHTVDRQPLPNLFLAAVHYLLWSHPHEELAKYYPSISDNVTQEVPFTLFRDFCMQYQMDIVEILQSRIVQTNAINRCSYLMPILANTFKDRPINLIDIGASAGLMLNMDRYAYFYDGSQRLGKSPVQINSYIQGRIPSFETFPRIQNRIGIDQNPLDVRNDFDANWLIALIWPDQAERLTRMKHAIAIANDYPVTLKKTSTLDDIAETMKGFSEDIPMAIYHTHVLYQFSPQERKEFRAFIDSIGEQRDLLYLAVEHSSIFSRDYGINGILVEGTLYSKGRKSNRLLAETNGHASWIKWY